MFYYIYSLLTFPGVIVHELAHAISCLFSGVKIYKIKFFSFGKTAGYVIHQDPNKFWQSLLISFGPLIVNSLVALFLFSLLRTPYLKWQTILYFWLAIAIGLHAIPSNVDAKSLLQSANQRVWRNPFVLVGYPLILVLYILNLFKKFHLDFIYAAFLFTVGRFYL